MANIKDVARIAGVSVSTVSRVVNDSASVAPEKRAVVEAAMKKLQYRPNSLARALVSRQSNCIGLMVGELDSPFFSQLMRGVDDVVVDGGRYLMITSGYHDKQREERALDLLQQRQCDALIVHSKALSDERLQALAATGTPVVFINRLVPGYEDRSIYLDNQQGAYLATRHLLSKGHRAIAFIGTSLAEVSDGAERLHGYQQALSEFNVPFNEDLCVTAQPTEDGGGDAMSKLLAHQRKFSAVMCYNDPMAAGAMGFLLDSGFEVPHDVSVVGFDDVVITRYLRPKLTTVHYPIELMGRTAAKLALQMLNKVPRLAESELRFAPRLVVRQSVKTFRES
ncbi:MAG: substrate-binding domain-containing protein [Natronospirillum sp.]